MKQVHKGINTRNIYSVRGTLWRVLFILIASVFIFKKISFSQNLFLFPSAIFQLVFICRSRQTVQSQLQSVTDCMFIQTKAFGNCLVFIHNHSFHNISFMYLMYLVLTPWISTESISKGKEKSYAAVEEVFKSFNLSKSRNKTLKKKKKNYSITRKSPALKFLLL